jgi:orotidine-5'-phosphate decarboxylase
MDKERNFQHMLEKQWSQGKFVCVGLDPMYERVPDVCKANHAHRVTHVSDFICSIIEATAPIAAAYKPNSAFYECWGDRGMQELRDLVLHIHRIAPDVPVLLDAKRADIGHTNTGYVKAAFEYFDADAITVNPYFGRESLQPFLVREDKGIIVLCRTSNPGASEFQDLAVLQPDGSTVPFYQVVARHVASEWNWNGNCLLVVGATVPEELAQVRKIVGDCIPILIPGVGTQGGDLKKAVQYGKDSRGKGFLINASSSIIFASSGEDFAEAAYAETLKLHEHITQYLTGGTHD